MASYATAMGRDPATIYRQVDLTSRTGGADGPALVQMLYEELTRALRLAAWATEHRQYALKSEKVTRATAILFALESNLDFEKGGDVSITLARLYAGSRRQVIDASVGDDPAPFRRIAADMDEIAAAWASVRRN